MKRIFLIFYLSISPIFLFSQIMNIHTNDGNLQHFNLSEIDSISFSIIPDTSEFIPIPLKINNSWTYSYTDPTGTSEYTNSIIALVVNELATFILSDDWLWDNNACYYSNGNLYGFQLDDEVNSLEIVFPSNPRIGDEWIVDGKTFSLDAINETITVPAGTYNCHKVKVQKESAYYVWWANNIGMIKLESAEENHELISFYLN
jgi:DUF3108-like